MRRIAFVSQNAMNGNFAKQTVTFDSFTHADEPLFFTVQRFVSSSKSLKGLNLRPLQDVKRKLKEILCRQ